MLNKRCKKFESDFGRRRGYWASEVWDHKIRWIYSRSGHCFGGFSSSLVAQAGIPVGIPRELARERAERVSDVRYRLRYTLVPKAAETLGHEEIRFHLKAAGPLLLDFREGNG